MKKFILICVCMGIVSVDSQCRLKDTFAKIGAALGISKARIPDRFKPSETWSHPTTLLHGSPDTGIDILRPKPLDNRCNGRPILFATQHFGLAAVFMQKHQGRFACGRLPNDEIFYLTNDKKGCIMEDHGGAIYVVPSSTFFCEAHISLGVDEWISYAAVRPLATFVFASALDAMLDFGVKVYFVDNATYSRYWRLTSCCAEWMAFFRSLRPLTRSQLEKERAALGIEVS